MFIIVHFSTIRLVTKACVQGGQKSENRLLFAFNFVKPKPIFNFFSVMERVKNVQ